MAHPKRSKIMIIKKLIEVNRHACNNIAGLEDALQNTEVVDEKSKVNFGNLCVALRGFRMVADATEAILINENVLKGDDGNFYQKIEEEVPDTKSMPGSDFDVDAQKIKANE